MKAPFEALFCTLFFLDLLIYTIRIGMYEKLKNYATRIDAEADGAVLKAQDISYIVSSDDAGGMRPDVGMSTGGVWLSVDEKDIDAAQTLLDT